MRRTGEAVRRAVRRTGEAVRPGADRERAGHAQRDAPRIDAEQATPAEEEKVMISGLDDVVVAETVLSEVDGQAGRLVIRGRSLDELVANATFERVVSLLWEDFFDGLPEPDHFAARLGAARCEAFRHLDVVDDKLLGQPLFDVMRALVAGLEDGADLKNALLLVAAPAVFTPAVIRLQKGLSPISPDPSLTHSGGSVANVARSSPSPQNRRGRWIATWSRRVITA